MSQPAALPAAHGARFALAALLAGALGIAFAPIFVRLADVGPSAIGFWRLALSLPLLALWMRVEAGGTAAPRRPESRRDRMRLLAAGLCFAGDLAVWHWSLAFTSVANATLFANFAPIFVTFGAWLLWRERPTLAFLAGMALAMAGAAALMGESFNVSVEHLMGDGLAVVAAMFYGGYILAVGRLRADFSTATIMTWSAVVSAVVLLPIAMLSGEALLPAGAEGWLVLFGLAWFSHAGGQSLIAYALAHLPAAFSAVALLLQPAAAAVLAWLLLGERLGPWQAAGGLIILAGIFLARRGSR
ncbi:MAG TPA: DMT family transporter [Alphaproteobacteria bacterium]|nr:DMT family transporter [Alphaproteobacteria bacterium]